LGNIVVVVYLGLIFSFFSDESFKLLAFFHSYSFQKGPKWST